MNTRDVVGERGEMICRLALTRFHGDAPLFRPVFLGDKWPHVDLLVEVVSPGLGARRSFFFAQVKTTRGGYLDNGRLKIPSIARESVEVLAEYPVPVYLFGVDERSERVYIVAVQGNIAGMSSMSVEHDLTSERRAALRDEVELFWRGATMPERASSFREAHWSVRP